MSKSRYYRTISPFAIWLLAGLSVAPNTVGAERHEVPKGKYLADTLLNTQDDPDRVGRLIKSGCLDPKPVDSPPVVTADVEVPSPTATASGVAVGDNSINQEKAGQKGGNSKARAKPAPKASTEVIKTDVVKADSTGPAALISAFVEGDVVRLKSGGPDMIVEGHNHEGMVTTSWENEDKTPASGAFAPATLELVE